MAEFILKDQYGKEKVFDHDKIFVQGTDGELVQFTEGTGDVPAVLQDKTITENGTYSADSGYDGLGNVTVEVKGGGGSLPAGIYWRQDDMVLPIHYGQRFFTFNGSLYLHAWSAKSSSGDHYVYKYENEQWVNKFTFAYISRFSIDLTAFEFNGKVHFIGQSYYHSTYDDESGPVALNDLPKSVYGYACFVHDGKLKAHNGDVDTLYVWDEATDSWSVEASFGENYSYRAFAVYNNFVYSYCKGKIYAYSNGELTYLYDVSNYISGWSPLFAVGKYLYVNRGAHGGDYLYKIDLENGNSFFLGRILRWASGNGRAKLRYIDGYGIRLHGCDYSAPDTFFNLIMHEVTE